MAKHGKAAGRGAWWQLSPIHAARCRISLQTCTPGPPPWQLNTGEWATDRRRRRSCCRCWCLHGLQLARRPQAVADPVLAKQVPQIDSRSRENSSPANRHGQRPPSLKHLLCHRRVEEAYARMEWAAHRRTALAGPSHPPPPGAAAAPAASRQPVRQPLINHNSNLKKTQPSHHHFLTCLSFLQAIRRSWRKWWPFWRRGTSCPSRSSRQRWSCLSCRCSAVG